MVLLMIGAQMVLLIWFLGCICTYRLGEYTLVEGMGIKSPEFVMLCLYVTGIMFSMILPGAGNWIVLTVLVFWLAVQFFSHWYFTIFGASREKIEGYNECFKNTVHIIPASPARIIPDLYHIVLHLLILLNIVLAVCNIAG